MMQVVIGSTYTAIGPVTASASELTRKIIQDRNIVAVLADQLIGPSTEPVESVR